MNQWEKILVFIAIITKAFFRATVDVAWGVAGILLLGILISQYIPDAQAIYNLQDLARFIYEYWALFWLSIFVLSTHGNLWRIERR